ncbi:hypothetical protein PsorP6_004131 [Peronosclerospora sorghi]|uniref:Uncharacterized protein n=1 Tax=Peronosclerospora sorghi TaxID=230839 RepID=A0ACC0VJC8_9STRA|nr:hypothetical protein PsorP6_004131 [Peronosclerospora sorghi]
MFKVGSKRGDDGDESACLGQRADWDIHWRLVCPLQPVSVVCGHSFCRVCLVTSLGMKTLDEAQCTICRLAILYPLSTHASVDAVLSVNVTLWNLV